MRTSLLSLLAVVVAAAPGCHESPAEITPTRPTENVGASSNDSSRMMRAMDPVVRLLDQRQELELSGNQVARLEAIQRRLAEQNNPLVTQLQDLHPDGARGRWLGLRGRQGPRHGRMRDLTPEQREEMREQMEELRPVLEQLRDNNQQALQEARAVLTEEQRTRLESRRQEMRREMYERRGERRGPRYRMRLESDKRDAQSEGESR